MKSLPRCEYTEAFFMIACKNWDLELQYLMIMNLKLVNKFLCADLFQIGLENPAFISLDEMFSLYRSSKTPKFMYSDILLDENFIY